MTNPASKDLATSTDERDHATAEGGIGSDRYSRQDAGRNKDSGLPPPVGGTETAGLRDVGMNLNGADTGAAAHWSG